VFWLARQAPRRRPLSWTFCVMSPPSAPRVFIVASATSVVGSYVPFIVMVIAPGVALQAIVADSLPFFQS
jgi:hypothetical protein